MILRSQDKRIAAINTKMVLRRQHKMIRRNQVKTIRRNRHKMVRHNRYKTLTDLPAELIYLIADHLHVRYLSRLVLTSCRLASLLDPILQDRALTYRCWPSALVPDWSVFELAASDGNANTIRKLLMHTERRGLEIPREVRHCALCLVASNDDTDSDLVELLVKVGKADMSALIWNGRRQTARRTALHWAVDGENEAAVRKLIELGANINAVDEDQLSVLHLAVSAEDYYDSVVPIAKLLLESGAMIEAKCPSGRTPLHTAADYLNERIIELLLDHGADIMARDNQGMTALHYAIKSGHLPSVVLLLERGGDLDATDNAGLSARESALQDEDDICPALQDENCICEFIKSLGGGQDDTKHQPSALLTPSPY